MDAPARYIDHPILHDTMPSVQRALGALIEGKTAVGYLDEQQHIGRRGNLCRETTLIASSDIGPA